MQAPRGDGQGEGTARRPGRLPSGRGGGASATGPRGDQDGRPHTTASRSGAGRQRPRSGRRHRSQGAGQGAQHNANSTGDRGKADRRNGAIHSRRRYRSPAGGLQDPRDQRAAPSRGETGAPPGADGRRERGAHRRRGGVVEADGSPGRGIRPGRRRGWEGPRDGTVASPLRRREAAPRVPGAAPPLRIRARKAPRAVPKAPHLLDGGVEAGGDLGQRAADGRVHPSGATSPGARPGRPGAGSRIGHSRRLALEPRRPGRCRGPGE